MVIIHSETQAQIQEIWLALDGFRHGFKIAAHLGTATGLVCQMWRKGK